MVCLNFLGFSKKQINNFKFLIRRLFQIASYHCSLIKNRCIFLNNNLQLVIMGQEKYVFVYIYICWSEDELKFILIIVEMTNISFLFWNVFVIFLDK